MFIIGINAILIGFETSDAIKKVHGKFFLALDDLFLSIYLIEFLIKVYADTKGYWKSAYNNFDFAILALSFLQILMSHLNVDDNYLGVFRLLRGKNFVILIISIPLLYFIVIGLIKSIKIFKIQTKFRRIVIYF